MKGHFPPVPDFPVYSFKAKNTINGFVVKFSGPKISMNKKQSLFISSNTIGSY